MDNNSGVPSEDIGGNDGGGDVEGLSAMGSDLSAKFDELAGKALKEEPEKIEKTPEMLACEEEFNGALVAFGTVTAATFAPGWMLQPEEIKDLAGLYSPLLAKYFPGGMAGFGPELSAVVGTVFIFGPRLYMPRKLEEEPEKSKEVRGDAANDGVSVSIDAVQSGA